VNVAEGAYVVILNWQAEGPAVKGAGVGYVSNNGKAWIQVSGDRFQGFIVSKVSRHGRLHCSESWSRSSAWKCLDGTLVVPSGRGSFDSARLPPRCAHD